MVKKRKRDPLAFFINRANLDFLWLGASKETIITNLIFIQIPEVSHWNP